MDLCYLKNSELEQKFEKNGRVVLRELRCEGRFWLLRYIHGAGFSSASQMTAAKVLDVIARLPGCSGQAIDAVSAYTQVKMERRSDTTETSQV